MSKKKQENIKENKEVVHEKNKTQTDFYDRINSFFQTKFKVIVPVLTLICVFVVYKLFDFKVSLEGDDASYIVRALNFLQDGTFPTWQGPLYPMVLSLIIKFFGFSITKLKMFSSLLAVANVPLFYLAFRKKVSAVNLFIGLVFMATNAFMLKFGSLTFTEIFFITQALIAVYLFVEVLDVDEFNLKSILLSVGVGLMIFLLGITKNVAFGVLASAILVLFWQKKWKQPLIILATFMVFTLGFSFVKKTVYHLDGAQVKAQSEQIFLKDPYNPDKGKEDFSGYIERFKGNSTSYLTKHFPYILGISDIKPDGGNGFLAFLIYILIGLSLFVAYKQKKYFLGFLLLFAASISLLVFLIQTSWDNSRLILIVVPFYIMALYAGVEQIAIFFNKKWISYIALAMGVLFVLPGFTRTLNQVEENSIQLQEGMNGNTTYGFPPEWDSYIKLSQFCADSLSLASNQRVLCRKPDVSVVYTGKNIFYGKYKSPLQSDSPESVLQEFDSLKVDYILQDQIAGTITNYLRLLGTKYPDKLQLVHTEQGSKPSYLYKINK